MSTPDLGPTPLQIARMRSGIQTRIEARRRRTRSLRISIAAGATTVIAALSVGIATISLTPTEVAATYSCYHADDVSAEFSGMQYPADLKPPTSVADQVDAALELCALVFEREQVAAPDPAVCRLPDQRFAVFPNVARLDDTDLCASVGLLPAAP